MSINKELLLPQIFQQRHRHLSGSEGVPATWAGTLPRIAIAPHPGIEDSDARSTTEIKIIAAVDLNILPYDLKVGELYTDLTTNEVKEHGKDGTIHPHI